MDNPSMKLRDPEFVGDFIKQEIDKFCKIYPEVNENRLREFCVPIQLGIETVLRENRWLQSQLDLVSEEVNFYLNNDEVDV